LANDGHVKIGTELDETGLKKGLSGLGGFAKKGFSAVGGAAVKASKIAAGAITGIGTAFAGAAAASVAAGVNFETSMTKASTLFGDIAVDADKLNARILDISSSTGVAASEMGEALYSALSAGLPVSEDMAETTEVLEKSAKLAKAGFTDVDTALAATAKTLNAYGLGVDAVDDIQKVLIQTQNLGITTVDELGASLAQVTPTAAAFGVSFDQVGAALAGMTAAGTPTAQATTQLNSLIAELGKNGTVAANNLKDAAKGTEYVGMSFNEMMDSGATLQDVLDMLGRSAEENGVSLVDMFSSIEAGKAALAIDGSDFVGNLAQMSTAADVVGEAYDKMSNTLQSNTERIKTSITNLGISIYEQIGGPLAGLSKIAAESVAELQSAFNENGFDGLLEAGANITGNLISGAVQQLPSVIEVATQFIDNLKSAFFKVCSNIAPVGGDIISSIITGMADTILDISIIGTHIMSTLAYSLADSAPMILETLGTCILDIVESFADYVPDFLDAGTRLFNSLVSGLRSGMQNDIPRLIAMGADMLTQLINGIANILPELAVAAADIVIGLADALTDPNTLISLIDAGFRLAEGLAAGLAEAIPKLIEAAPKIIANLVTALIASAPRLLVASANIMHSIGKGMVQSISNLLKAIPDIFKKIVSKFKELDWAAIGKNLIDGIKKGVSDKASEMIDSVIEAAKKAIDEVKDFLGIHSPSRLARDVIGKNLIAGIGVGIEQETPKLVTRSQRSMDKLISGIKSRAYNMYPEHRQERPAQRAERQESNKDTKDTQVSVKVVLEGDAKGVFKVVSVEEEKFYKSTGKGKFDHT